MVEGGEGGGRVAVSDQVGTWSASPRDCDVTQAMAWVIKLAGPAGQLGLCERVVVTWGDRLCFLDLAMGLWRHGTQKANSLHPGRAGGDCRSHGVGP